MESPPLNLKIAALKKQLRLHLLTVRSSIADCRRKEASLRLLNFFRDCKVPVLSFASLPQEIDTYRLNHHLAKSNQLLLPKIEGNQLEIYHVSDLNTLQIGPLNILEPSALHPKASPLDVEIVLVPGLGFAAHHRIGYGKGFYDRLLPTLLNAKSYGIGFREQFVKELPLSPEDFPLSETFFF